MGVVFPTVRLDGEAGQEQAEGRALLGRIEHPAAQNSEALLRVAECLDDGQRRRAVSLAAFAFARPDAMPFMKVQSVRSEQNRMIGSAGPPIRT